MNPRLLKSKAINADAKERAKIYIEKSMTPIGAYTSNSKGDPYFRQIVADYIGQRDDVVSDIDNIYLTNGASEGVRLALSLLIRNKNDGIMIPIP